MTNPTPRDSAQLPPAEFVAQMTAAWEGPWANAADTIIHALRAQAASVEPVGEVQWAAGVPNSIREVVFFDPPCPPVGTKLYAGAPPAHIPADASHDSIRFLNHALKLADRLPDTEISYTLRLYLAGAHAPLPQAVAASSPAPKTEWTGEKVFVASVMGLDVYDTPDGKPATAVDAVGSMQALDEDQDPRYQNGYERGYAAGKVDESRAALQASRQPQAQQALAEGAGDGRGPWTHADTARIDALARPGWELSQNNDPECRPEELWQVHRVSGGRNDREWTLIGQGETPRAAIDAALATKERS